MNTHYVAHCHGLPVTAIHRYHYPANSRRCHVENDGDYFPISRRLGPRRGKGPAGSAQHNTDPVGPAGHPCADAHESVWLSGEHEPPAEVAWLVLAELMRRMSSR